MTGNEMSFGRILTAGVNMKAWLFLIMLSCPLCVKSQVDNIFIGGFYGFGPMGYEDFWFDQPEPSIEKDRLFVWLFNRVPYDTTLHNEDRIYKRGEYIGLITSTATQRLDSLELSVGMPVYFLVDYELYETKILEFLFTDFDKDSARMYASCQIPDTLKAGRADLRYVDPICSTSKPIAPLYDFPGTPSQVDEVRRYGKYTIHRHLEDTGKLGDIWGEKLFISWVDVRFDTTSIFRTDTNRYPVDCSYGDFNGDGKLDIYLRWNKDDDALHQLLMELSGDKYRIKDYVTELYD